MKKILLLVMLLGGITMANAQTMNKLRVVVAPEVLQKCPDDYNVNNIDAYIQIGCIGQYNVYYEYFLNLKKSGVVEVALVGTGPLEYSTGPGYIEFNIPVGRVTSHTVVNGYQDTYYPPTFLDGILSNGETSVNMVYSGRPYYLEVKP